VRRGKKRRTTIVDEAALERARDLLRRDFVVSRPNEKWVADITYIRTWNGFVHLAFVLDCYSRMIVGWQLATHLRTDLVLDALEMANGLRRPAPGLIAHTDRGSQYTSLRYTDRLDELGAAPSVGSRGDAYDNAMATNPCESMIEIVRYTQRNVKRWQDGDMRKRWTAAGMLVAEQQFRRIIGYRDLATLVIATERHAPLAAPNDQLRQEIAEPVTV